MAHVREIAPRTQIAQIGSLQSVQSVALPSLPDSVFALVGLPILFEVEKCLEALTS